MSLKKCVPSLKLLVSVLAFIVSRQPENYETSVTKTTLMLHWVTARPPCAFFQIWRKKCQPPIQMGVYHEEKYN